MVDGDHVQLEASKTVTVYFIQLSVLLLVMEYFYCEVFALLTEVKQPSSKWNLMNLRDENVSSVCKYLLQRPAHVLLAVIRPLCEDIKYESCHLIYCRLLQSRVAA